MTGVAKRRTRVIIESALSMSRTNTVAVDMMSAIPMFVTVWIAKSTGRNTSEGTEPVAEEDVHDRRTRRCSG